MLIKLLSKEEAGQLLPLAWLFAVADKPLLCNGELPQPGMITYSKDALSIDEGALERELLEDLERSVGKINIGFTIKNKVVHAIRQSNAFNPNDEAFRADIAASIINEELCGFLLSRPSASKIMLFELFVVALRDGHISAIEMAMLKIFQAHHRLEDFIFDDLLERAEALSKELSKTISICLE